MTAPTLNHPSSTSPSPEPPLVVRVTNSGFEPSVIRVVSGRRVKFLVEGRLSHLITGPNSLQSPLLRPGSSFEFTFTEGGDLRDEVLSYVRGTVEVFSEGAPPPEQAPSPSAASPVAAAMPTWEDEEEIAAAPETPAPSATAPVSSAFLEPGARAGKWSGLSWETVQTRYRQLKEEYSSSGVSPPAAAPSSSSSQLHEEAASSRPRPPRPSSS